MTQSIPQLPDSRESKMVTIKRDEAGSPTVWCDPEIADLVKALNDGGIPTVASCSGHGSGPGRISLRDGRDFLLFSCMADANAAHLRLQQLSDECPKCKGVEWDRVERERGVHPSDLPFNRCPCGHEWSAALSQPMAAIPEGLTAATKDANGWCLYIAGMLDCYLRTNPPEETREAAMAGIIERRLHWFSGFSAAPQPPAGQQITAAPQGGSALPGWMERAAQEAEYTAEVRGLAAPPTVVNGEAVRVSPEVLRLRQQLNGVTANLAQYRERYDIVVKNCNKHTARIEELEAALPPGRGMVPMHDDEVRKVYRSVFDENAPRIYGIAERFARAIEAHHGIVASGSGALGDGGSGT